MIVSSIGAFRERHEWANCCPLDDILRAAEKSAITLLYHVEDRRRRSDRASRAIGAPACANGAEPALPSQPFGLRSLRRQSK